MTEQELAAVQARADAASAGPWTWTYEEEGDLVSPGPFACACEFSDHGRQPIITTDMGAYGPCTSDRAFIASARTDVPALVAEVRRLRALVESAFEEGRQAGAWHSQDGCIIGDFPEDWADSTARAALDGTV